MEAPILRSVPKAKKRKKTKLKTLFKKAERLWSLYIRDRDKACVICGTKKNLTNGHLITRSKKSVFFDPKNSNCQCTSCNYKHEFNPEIYTAWFLNKYGLEEYNSLCQKSESIKKWTEDELLTLINECEWATRR